MSVNAKKDLKTLLQALDNDPIRRLKEMMEAESKIGEAENIRKYQTIALIYDFIDIIMEDREIKKEFLMISSRYYTNRALDEDGLTRRTSRYVLGAESTSGARYTQALAYAKVIKHLQSQNLSPNQVFDELVEKSIYGVLNEIDKAKTKPAEEVEERSTDATRAMTYHFSDQQKCDDADLQSNHADEIDSRQIIAQRSQRNAIKSDDIEPSEIRLLGAGGSSARNATKRQKYPFNENVEIAVEAPKYIDRMLKMAIHDEVSVTIKRIEDQDGWTKFEMTEFERLGKLH